jgi:hypothetical protein
MSASSHGAGHALTAVARRSIRRVNFQQQNSKIPATRSFDLLTAQFIRNNFALEQKPLIDHFRDEMIRSDPDAFRKDARTQTRHSPCVLAVALRLFILVRTSCTSSYRRPELARRRKGFSGVAYAHKGSEGDAIPLQRFRVQGEA